MQLSRHAAASCLLAGCFLLSGQANAQQEGNETFTFQARVTSNGVPLESAGLTLTFEVWDTPSGTGTVLWDQVVNDVPVQNGFLSVELGGAATDPVGNTFSPAAGPSRNRYMAIKSAGVDLVSPRIKLTAAPMAINAEIAVGLDDGTGSPLTITQLDARYSTATALSDGAGGALDLAGLDSRYEMAESLNDGSGNPLNLAQLDTRYDARYAPAGSGGATALPSQNALRISISSTDPAPENTTGSNVYLHRYKGKSISLYYGGEWRTYQTSTTPPYVSLSGQSGSTVFDIFAVPNSESGFYLTFEAWSSLSTRQSGSSVGIEKFDGVWVKKGGSTNRSRYLGTVFSYFGTITDSPLKRDVWNIDNQVRRIAYRAYAGGWGSNYSTDYTEINPGARLTFVMGLTGSVTLDGTHQSSGSQFEPLRIGVGYLDFSTLTSLSVLSDNTLNDDDDGAQSHEDIRDMVSTRATVGPGRRVSTLMWSLTPNSGQAMQSMGDMKNRVSLWN